MDKLKQLSVKAYQLALFILAAIAVNSLYTALPYFLQDMIAQFVKGAACGFVVLCFISTMKNFIKESPIDEQSPKETDPSKS